MVSIHPTARLRQSPFYEATLADGMISASVYNGMLMPTSYGDPQAEYWRIINGVSQWDVAVERQVEITGPDAAVLAQILSARDLSKCAVGQGKYAPLCDHDGTLLNDPIALKLDDNHFWFSIADSDMWLWARAVAAERKLNVRVTEPDVSPMAVQGPMAEDVIAHICGDWVRDLKYFWFDETEIDHIPVVVARSGWSKQGGFEIYLRDGRAGTRLWEVVREAGQPWGIGPGAPATAERTESGLVSVGGDTDGTTNPFEVRLGDYVSLNLDDDVIGIPALKRIAQEGPARHLLGLRLDEDAASPLGFRWEEITDEDGKQIGHMTNCVWSPRLNGNIGYGLVSREAKEGDRVVIRRPYGPIEAGLCALPFI